MRVGKAKRLRRQARLARQGTAWIAARTKWLSTGLTDAPRVVTYEKSFIQMGDGPFIHVSPSFVEAPR
jgi:hypothetical protein